MTITQSVFFQEGYEGMGISRRINFLFFRVDEASGSMFPSKA